MDEYRVPTVRLEVEVLRQDGSLLAGRIFMPALSAVHAGPMALEEWANAAPPFFPFAAAPNVRILLNKRQVLALITTPAPAPEAGPDPDDAGTNRADVPVRRVSIEAGGRRFDGLLVIDMPISKQRVLDYMNRPEPFLLLHLDDGRQCLIHRSFITSVSEVEGV